MRPKPIRVVLSDEQLNEALEVKKLRRADSIRRGCKDKHGIKPEHTDASEVLGAEAEYAFTLAMHITWSKSVGTFKHKPDAILKTIPIEVRGSTFYKARLIHRSDDSPDRYFVLVVKVNRNTFDVVGWIKGEDARRDIWLDNPSNRGECWMVPQEFLHPMIDLIRLAEGLINHNSVA